MSRLMSLCLFFFLSVALAAPLISRTVYDPPITNPNAKTVWTVGTVQTVTWNATGIPEGIPGKLQLGFLTSESENLSTILAQGFNLTDEKVQVTVPDVVKRSNYILVLFGDSGNISPEFTIEGGSASASGSTTSASPSSTTAVLSNKPTPPIVSGPGLSSTRSASGTSASTSTSDSVTTTPGTSSSASAALDSSGLPSPSPSPSSGWSINKFTTSRLMLATATAVLVQYLFSL
ncbi:hypothetical protein C8F01DRAFT_1113496 [Mycena amicta]|nr:hypothetical protein C8F01DRAFT_1113496 [Mycena amicta]